MCKKFKFIQKQWHATQFPWKSRRAEQQSKFKILTRVFFKNTRSDGPFKRVKHSIQDSGFLEIYSSHLHSLQINDRYGKLLGMNYSTYCCTKQEMDEKTNQKLLFFMHEEALMFINRVIESSLAKFLCCECNWHLYNLNKLILNPE